MSSFLVMSTIHGERQGSAGATIECVVESKAANDENWPCAVNRQEIVNQPERELHHPQKITTSPSLEALQQRSGST